MADQFIKRYRFTEIQLNAYLERIEIPQSKRHLSLESLNELEKLGYFQLLFKHHLVSIPWENLSMHYSWHHVIDVDPRHLYQKVVASGNRGRGGYCFETNILFFSVLYALGFDVYLAGSRIYNPTAKAYGGWSHVVCIVTLQGSKYIADGGYGGNGLTRAIMLEHGVEHVHVASSKMRLMHLPIAQNLDRSQKLWIYQHRISAEHNWQPHFCFTELEFLPEDIERLSVSVSSWRYTWFAHKVAAVRFTTAGEGLEGDEKPGSATGAALEAEIDGSITLAHSRLYWRRNGINVVDIQMTTEKERLHALNKYFGIKLDEDEARRIGRTGAELTDVPFSI